MSAGHGNTNSNNNEQQRLIGSECEPERAISEYLPPRPYRGPSSVDGSAGRYSRPLRVADVMGSWERARAGGVALGRGRGAESKKRRRAVEECDGRSGE